MSNQSEKTYIDLNPTYEGLSIVPKSYYETDHFDYSRWESPDDVLKDLQTVSGIEGPEDLATSLALSLVGLGPLKKLFKGAKKQIKDLPTTMINPLGKKYETLSRKLLSKELLSRESYNRFKLTEKLGGKTTPSLTFREYKKNIKASISSGNTDFHWEGGILSPKGRRDYGAYYPDSSQKGSSGFITMNPKKKYTMPGNISQRGLETMSTGVHELKHASQHGVWGTSLWNKGGRLGIRNPNSPVYKAYMDAIPKKFKRRFSRLKGGNQTTINPYKTPLEDLPAEIGARLSELRSLPKSMVTEIYKNPATFKNIKQVKWLTDIFGTGDRFKQAVDKLWVLPAAYFGAKGLEETPESLLDSLIQPSNLQGLHGF